MAPAALAGLFAALSPQFAWNSVLLLPDSLAVFPILLAVYLLARSREKPKLVIHRVFITAVFLPLVLIGLGLTIYRRQNAPLLILSVVPLYFFTVQSAFHTEYRYVLAVNYFLFAFAAVAISWVAKKISRIRTTTGR